VNHVWQTVWDFVIKHVIPDLYAWYVHFDYVQPKTKQQQNLPPFSSASVDLMLPPFLSHTFLSFITEWYTREIWWWIGEDMCSNILKLNVLELTCKYIVKKNQFWYKSKTKNTEPPSRFEHQTHVEFDDELYMYHWYPYF
jgi:hypothetical protein